ncbi:MAG: hypothetical protein AAB775_01055 [Patescibacteria group bacterium]
MLIPKPDIRIISRKVTLKNGTEALAYFAVINVQGVLEFKFLGMKMAEAPSVSPKIPMFLLENPRQKIFGETPVKSLYEFFSPFYSLDFLVSQMARAPSVE